MAKATPTVKAALETYAETLKASYAAVGVAAGAEEQLKSPVKTLIEACVALAPSLSKTKDVAVLALLETSIKGTGRPDVGVLLDGLLVGHIELKAPEKLADPTKLRDAHDKAQWKKFQLLPNLIYTNGIEWRMYRWDGSKPERIGQAVKLGDYIKNGAAAVTDADAAAFSAMVQTFFAWKVATPTTPEGLANLLAPLARLFRQEVTEALKVEGSNIQNVRNLWKQTLFPRATDEQFSDIYAQTVTYALLAQLDGANILNTAEAVKTLRGGHELLASALKILVDDQLQDELGTGLQTLLRVISALDSKAFKAQEERLWLYFYEYFLAAYDRDLRNKYGVYYTPTQVIGAQVRLVDEVLKTRLGKMRGYSDDGVVVLDPAAGTGAYPLAVIAHALEEAEAYGAGMVPSVATSLAEKIHAFEILVGPYAVAHLRVSQAVQNAGGHLPADGAHVYLNDTLESPNATNPTGLPFILNELTDEHRRAQRVKQETPVMVTLGNPPMTDTTPVTPHAADGFAMAMAAKTQSWRTSLSLSGTRVRADTSRTSTTTTCTSGAGRCGKPLSTPAPSRTHSRCHALGWCASSPPRATCAAPASLGCAR